MTRDAWGGSLKSVRHICTCHDNQTHRHTHTHKKVVVPRLFNLGRLMINVQIQHVVRGQKAVL